MNVIINPRLVHVVLFATCPACLRYDVVTFDHSPTPEEIAAARPSWLSLFPCLTYRVHATRFRERGR